MRKSLDQVENTYREFMDKAVQNEKVRSIYGLGSPSEKPLGEVQKSQSRTLSSKGTSRLKTSETKTGPLSKHEALERAVNVFRETKSGANYDFYLEFTDNGICRHDRMGQCSQAILS
jgi:hypothetical protein